MTAIVLSEEGLCRLCGQPPRPDDPLEVHHLRARADGGGDERSNLAAAHRSCNSKRGASLI
jgi:5-methylcytosine-specific restriction endonuclease McrA